METNKLVHAKTNVCDLSYLAGLMEGKTKLITDIMEAFLIQLPGELKSINEAVSGSNFKMIKSLAHHLKSSVSIMGISVLKPILMELEELGSGETAIDKIRELAQKLNAICMEATEELIRAKSSYA